MFLQNIAIKDLLDTLRKFPSWVYLAYFDLKLKYRKTYLGPLWVVFGMAISAGLLCLLWSVIFKLDWQNYLLYIFSGFIIWTWLMTIVIEGPEVFSSNSELLKTFAILAFDGGKCKEIAKYPMHFAVKDMQIAEDIQLIIGHLCMQWLSSNKPDFIRK